MNSHIINLLTCRISVALFRLRVSSAALYGKWFCLLICIPNGFLNFSAAFTQLLNLLYYFLLGFRTQFRSVLLFIFGFLRLYRFLMLPSVIGSDDYSMLPGLISFPFWGGISIFSCSTESDLLVNSRLAFALHPVATRIPDVLPSFFPYATGFYLAVNKLILLSAFSPKNKFV